MNYCSVTMRRTHIIDGNSEINTDGDSSYLFDSDSSGAFTEMFSDKKSFFMRDFDPRDGDTEISVGRRSEVLIKIQ